MEQAQLELQLKVWKELAISKQLLMRTATDALKLDPDCTQEQLKQALEGTIKKINEAEANVAQAQEQARLTVTELEKKLAAGDKALTIAEAQVVGLRLAQEKATQQMATERAAAAKELQKFKDGLSEKDKALKAINTALADTPENVLKKMKALKKEKQDEADSRRLVETSLNTLRKEKREQDQQLNALKESSAKLVTQYRDLHAVGAKLHEQLKPLIADAKDLSALPELDSTLIEAVENPGAKKEDAKDKDQNEKDDKKNKKGKGAK